MTFEDKYDIIQSENNVNDNAKEKTMMKKNCLMFFCIAVCGLLNISVPKVVYAEEEIEIPLEEGYIRYEAEDAIINDATLKGKVEGSSADYGHYSGLGFVGSIDYQTSRVTFTVNVSEDGNYPLNVGYAIDPSFGTATFNVYVNNQFYTTISLSVKKGWGAFYETGPMKTSINLYEGSNTIDFIKGYNYAELDYIDIGSRNGPFITPSVDEKEIEKVPDGFTRYEAEDGKITSGVVYKTGTFSGSGYVGDLNLTGISKIDFTVHAEEEGEYALRLAYAIGDGFNKATFKLYNDAGLYTTIVCEKTFGWGSFEVDAIAESSISLRQGENVISLYKSIEYAQIDFIDLSSAKIGEYKDSNIVVSQPNLQEGYVRYEAEEQLVILAQPKGIGFIVDIGNYSGMGYVGSLDNDDCYIEIPITVEEDGEYQIRIAYACVEENASLKLYSGTYGRGGNTYFYKEEFFKNVSEDWGFFDENTIVTTSICLKKGKSFIIIRSGLIRAEVDYVDVGKKIGDYYEGTYEESLNRNNKGE